MRAPERAAVPAHPAEGGVQFTCGCCGTQSRTLTEGGAPEAGAVLDVACEHCASVNRLTVRAAMFS